MRGERDNSHLFVPAMPNESAVRAAALAQAVARAGPPHVPLAVVSRGDGIDAVHCGSVAVVDRDGAILFAAGDPHFVTMTRSALKPFQAMPFVAGGGVERFGYSKAQVALMCASHSGEPRQSMRSPAMLAAAGNTAAELQCGTHAPGYYDVRGELPPPPPYSPLAHNCSGKHSGMLAYCVQCGLPKESYLAYDHPLQQAIRRAVAHFTAVPEASLITGIDGCSAPNYAVPLACLAQAFARLAADGADPEYGRAPGMLADAMTAHPEMVSGDGRNDLALMRGRSRRLGDEDRRGGRAGDRRAEPRTRHRHQGRRRRQARPPSGDGGGAGPARAARCRAARPACVLASNPWCATTAEPLPARCDRRLSWTN